MENDEEEGSAVKERDFSSGCRTCETYLALLQLFLSATPYAHGRFDAVNPNKTTYVNALRRIIAPR